MGLLSSRLKPGASGQVRTASIALDRLNPRRHTLGSCRCASGSSEPERRTAYCAQRFSPRRSPHCRQTGQMEGLSGSHCSSALPGSRQSLGPGLAHLAPMSYRNPWASGHSSGSRRPSHCARFNRSGRVTVGPRTSGLVAVSGDCPPERLSERADSYSTVACSLSEKNSSAFFVFVSCSPERSMSRCVRNALASAPTWNASEGAHFVDSSRIIELSG